MLPKDPSELGLTRHPHDVLQSCLLNKNISFGLNKNKWVCTSQAFNSLSPGWSMYQQILVFEHPFLYREFHWEGGDILMAEDSCWAPQWHSELGIFGVILMWTHSQRRKLHKINCADQYLYWCISWWQARSPIEGKQSLNKVWAQQGVPDGNQKFRAHQSHLHAHITGTNQTLIND